MRFTRHVLPILLLVICSSRARPQAARDTIEQGRFAIHNLQQRVGYETYAIVRNGDARIVSATWDYAYLRSPVALTANLELAPSGAPTRLRIKGATSTWTQIDADVAVSATAPGNAFPLTHYPPIALEQALYRHWVRSGRPARIALLPEGEASFTRMGVDTVPVDGRREVLTRFLVTGVIWGRQSLWVDTAQRVIAAVGGNAELDRSEYVRAGYESALAVFVNRSVSDGMDAIARLRQGVSPIASGNFAITGARIIDVIGGNHIERGTIVVQNGRISAVGANVAIPPRIQTIDASGKTVLPGLWDMHVHYEQVEWPLVSLAAGVTTVRDAANEFELITALRRAQREGRILSPTILAAGVIDGSNDHLGVIFANTPDEAHAAVRRYRDAGFEQIKIYQSVPPALVKVITDEAHRLGMTVTGHVPSGMTARQFIEAGADQINHFSVASLFRPPPAPGVAPQPLDMNSEAAKTGIRFLLEHGTVIDPSFARGEEGTHWRGHYELVEPGVLRVPVELRVPLQSTGVDSAIAERARPNRDRSAAIAKVLRDAGVPIVLGTDLTVPGFSIYREMELAVRGGFSALDAIQAATIVPARAMKRDSIAGSLTVGKRADLVILTANPLDRIENVRSVETVVIGGIAYRSSDLWRLAGFR